MKGPDEHCERPWVPEQLQWWRCPHHQPLRKVACSLVFFKRDPLVFPSCFIDESHLVEPGGECSQSTAQEGVKAKVSARQLSSSKGLVTAEARLQTKCFSRMRLESLLCPSLCPSRWEELGRALSIAILGYGIPIGVLVLHALG